MDAINFKINYIHYSVGTDVASTTTLLEFIRNTLELRGTKFMCLEAGCGACIVTAKRTTEDTPISVNACMIPITSCQDWDITTIEEIGNRLDGYHPIQTTLAANNGSQCGYCTPGWVMALYSLLKTKQMTMLEIEQSFGSNVCRCTGYRPILQAFKKFASDAPDPLVIPDIEDLKLCDKTGKTCFKEKCVESDWCFVNKNEVRSKNKFILLKDHRYWYRVETVADVFDIWHEIGTESYRLINGNTGKGVIPILAYPKILIDISGITELRGHYVDQNLVLGAGTTLTDTINIFSTLGKLDEFNYLNVFVEHLNLVAHIPVRNVGTLAGNLMLKHQNPEFQSDIYLLLQTAGAQLVIVQYKSSKILSMDDFLIEDMRGKIIFSIILPPLSTEHKVVTYKITPRSQNAHAIVHAGFNYRLKDDNSVINCRIIYGGLSAIFYRAFKTELYLIGKKLFENETLQGALNVLNQEIIVIENLPEYPAEYRRQLALNLFYKGLLTLCPLQKLHPHYHSGPIKLHEMRPTSNGIQVATTDPSIWPLNQSIPKVDGLIQCAGEAKYTDDLPSLPNEVFAAFVLTTVALGKIESIDPSKALEEHGVIAFYTSADIPGLNTFTVPTYGEFNIIFSYEELLCNGEVKFYNQPLGIIVADSYEKAQFASNLVKVTYSNVKQPIFDIKIAKYDPSKISLYRSIEPTRIGTDIDKVIRGENTIYAQYHFCMENMACITVPTEEGLKVYATTQWTNLIQTSLSQVLNLDQNRIQVYVRRLGGAYGLKISRVSQVAMASGLVSYKLNRPCRFVLPLTSIMRAVGKRLPCSTNFEIAVNKHGVIQYLNQDFYSDNGYVVDEPLLGLGLDSFSNVYKSDNWNHKAYNAITDTPSNSWCRSPGTLEHLSMAEAMIERIAYEVNVDPLKVRLANLDIENHKDMLEMLDTLKINSEYEDRKIKVAEFNFENRWKKRGLRFSFLRWRPSPRQYFQVNLSVYNNDGSVSIGHGGIEMGQGINTKAVQVCAYLLGIPKEKIQIVPHDTFISPNNFACGGSTTSQNITNGVRKCCEELLHRLEPARVGLVNPTWEELIKQAYKLEIDLQVHSFLNSTDDQIFDVYGLTLAEVEIDVLTGESEIIRVDLIEDAGQSVSPGIDVGQVEGAFIMGVGYWTSERLVFEPTTGELLTNRTWEYWVPQARDIPWDFRVYFRKSSYSSKVIFGSKVTGEPATCMGISVTFALRHAITAARMDSGISPTQWFQIVGSDVSSNTTLLDYIRYGIELRGTKYMCLEGGCGACIVSIVKSPGEKPEGVNSCLVPITSCNDWEITTIEGIGNRLKGYHPIQKVLAENHGSQCGYCSPGWVMALYSILQNKKPTMLEMEQSFGSNICRCTGYRPILDALKTFASNYPTTNIEDIEDLKICDKTKEKCIKDKCGDADWCFVTKNQIFEEPMYIKLNDGRDWYKVLNLVDVFAIWNEKSKHSYMLVAGNTGKGVYPILEYPQLLIDITGIKDLQGYYLDQNLVIGAGNTLTEVLNIFKSQANEEYFNYLSILREHIKLVAHITVRNRATLAGNLMLKNVHSEFKSDIFLLLETVGAEVNIMTSPSVTKTVSMKNFLNEDMRGKIIISIIFPPLSNEYKLVTYKIMPRSQNAHAIIHAGFLYQMKENNTVNTCRIVYSGLNNSYTRASRTEGYLKGKILFKNETLKGALSILDKELVVVECLPNQPAEHRRKMALGLFYKGLLSLCPSNVLGERFKSGAIKLRDTRPVSKAQQVFDTDPSKWPLNQPIQKVDALIQCAGEAEFTEDLPKLPDEVFAAFVLSNVALGTIKKIDPSKALKEPGVIAFYSASDIPGVNSFTPAPVSIFLTTDEEIIAATEVKYYNQPVGIIVANNQYTANKAATLVEVTYKNVRKPIIDVKITKNDPNKISLALSQDAKSKGTDIVKVIKGEYTIYGQYHFCMETLVSVTQPTEEGIKVHAATQWMDTVQRSISRMLKISQNRFTVVVRRLGGAFGYKISRISQVASACALVSYKLNRPCRFIQTLTNNMRAVGKRLPCSLNFEVGVNSQGAIQYINHNIYSDSGYIVNEPLIMLGVGLFNNCYKKDLFNYKVYNVVTDTPSNSWCRSPGTLEHIAMAEIVMERIACELNLESLQVRLANLDTEKYGDINELLETLKVNSNYEERKNAVEVFNNTNMWKKRGLRFTFLSWPPAGNQYFDVLLSVYNDDGSITISHGAIEMGQGVNTRAIQTCAYLLNIPVEKIRVAPSDTTKAPNGLPSGGSISSQNVVVGVKKCCEELLKRLEPVKQKLDNPTWEQLIKKAWEMEVNLLVASFVNMDDKVDYIVFGVTLLEIEIDVLTGEWQIIRVDLIEDCGQSINPKLDLGQIEGAFIMGTGYFTTEQLVMSPTTGELLTNRTWDYWVMQALDIPQDFRIYLRKRSYSSPLILGSKATGEPATCMGIVVTFALRQAIAAARKDSGIAPTEWLEIDGPFTVDKICYSCSSLIDNFKFY